jgi:phage tail-like protein
MPPLEPARTEGIESPDRRSRRRTEGGTHELQLQSGQPLKLPAKRTPPTVTLERGLTSDTALWAWREAALAGAAGGRKGADLVMFDAEGTPVARYHLEQAWPSKLEIGALEAGASEVLMETVTIVCEKIQRVSV